jgi:hypothetical protein
MNWTATCDSGAKVMGKKDVKTAPKRVKKTEKAGSKLLFKL